MNYKYDIIKNKNKFFSFSSILIAIIIAILIFKGVSLDIQFKGGTIATYSYENDLDVNDIETNINKVYSDNIVIQLTEDVATKTKQFIVSFTSSKGLTTEEIKTVSDSLITSFANNKISELQVSNVSPSLGRDFLLKSLVAIGLAFIMMVVYIAIRFKNIGGLSAGLMAVVALIHDVTIVFGVFVILGFPIDNNFIAVVLTILGYSVNDTIVIYDRVRENRNIYGNKIKTSDLMNLSINQCLSRSINTTISTVISLIVISIVAILFNVSSILSLSIPLTV
ncbi:MAG: protein translocase subunit SecF, partial [Oscillospiraceae bacterium]